MNNDRIPNDADIDELTKATLRGLEAGTDDLFGNSVTASGSSNDPWVLTYTGQHFNLLHPQPEDVNIIDIAHSLSMQCRYNGHTRQFYSVAEHCVVGARWLQLYGQETGFRYASDILNNRFMALHFLLHDAPEYVTGDMVYPLKTLLKDDKVLILDDIAESVHYAIMRRFGLDVVKADSVLAKVIHKVDTDILLAEYRALMTPDRLNGFVSGWGRAHDPDDYITNFQIHCWEPARAEKEYLDLFAELMG